MDSNPTSTSCKPSSAIRTSKAWQSGCLHRPNSSPRNHSSHLRFERMKPWWALSRGDLDTTIAQVGFNLAQMVIPVFLLLPVGISAGFTVTHLLPGFAFGFLIGSLGLILLAIRLANRQGRADVTAHAYGNNVPAIIAYTLSIMLPVYLESHDA